MLRELKTFATIARAGTFAAAADRIGLTQAAVSAQVRRLESELGFALFDRSGRTARLNARGVRTLARAQDLIALHERLGADEDDGEDAGGLLKIGAIASVQRGLLPSALVLFHAAHPGYRTQVLPGVSMDLLDRADAGDIDLAVLIRPPFALPGDLRWTALAQEPYRLLVPRGVRGSDWRQLLAAHRFVRYDRASFGGRRVDRFLRAARIGVRDICEVDELEAIVQLVAGGLGVALVPQTADHAGWPEGVRAVDLGEATFHREIGLVHRAQPALHGAAQDLLRAICGAHGAPLASVG